MKSKQSDWPFVGIEVGMHWCDALLSWRAPCKSVNLQICMNMAQAWACMESRWVGGQPKTELFNHPCTPYLCGKLGSRWPKV